MSESNNLEPMSMRAYVWFGFGAGMFFGIFLLMKADQPGSLGLLSLPAAALVGTVDGYVLYRTRHWSRRHYHTVVLRYALALGIALMALSDLSVLAGLSTRREALEFLSVIPAGSLAVAWMLSRKRYVEAPPKPTVRDVAILGGLLALLSAVAWFGYHAAQRVAT